MVSASSSSKYIVRPPKSKKEEPEKKEELSFSDKALTLGAGILTRLKSRLNLEETTQSLKDKKDKITGKKEEDQDTGQKKDKEKEGS